MDHGTAPSDFGINVSKSFLLLVEELSYQIDMLGSNVSNRCRTKVQA